MRLKSFVAILSLVVMLISISSFAFAQSESSCSDSDNGMNYTISGITTYYGEGGYVGRDEIVLTYPDTCINETTLKENFCESNLTVRDESYSCLNLGSGYRCESGRCTNIGTCNSNSDCPAGNGGSMLCNMTTHTCGSQDISPPGTVTGAFCNITTRSTCYTNSIVLGLSSLTNAHAQLYSQTTYPYVLCCQGSIVDQSCSTNNSVLKLASASNAHAGTTLYTNNVCLKDMICSAKATCDIASGEEAILSLSGISNAHVAVPSGTGAYATKLCCKSGTSLGGATWRNMIDQVINQADLNDLVKLSVAGTGFEGKRVEFRIKKQNAVAGIDWLYPDSTILQSSTFGYVTWRAGKINNNTAELQAGSYYFEARISGTTDWISTVSNSNPSFRYLEVSSTEFNNPPVANISSPHIGDIYGKNVNVWFSADGSYDVDDELITEWVLGDNNETEEWEFNHSYSNAGQKNIRLTVIDDRGTNSKSDVKRVAILIVQEGRNIFGMIRSPEDGKIEVTTDSLKEEVFEANTFAIDCDISGGACGHSDCSTSDNYPGLYCGGMNDLKGDINLNWTTYNCAEAVAFCNAVTGQLLFSLSGRNEGPISQSDRDSSGAKRGTYNQFWRDMTNGKYFVKLNSQIADR